MLHCLSISAAKKKKGLADVHLACYFCPCWGLKLCIHCNHQTRRFHISWEHFHSADCRCRCKSESQTIILLLFSGSRNWQSQLPHRHVYSSTGNVFECLCRSCKQLHHILKKGNAQRADCANCSGLRALLVFSAGAADYSSGLVLPLLMLLPVSWLKANQRTSLIGVRKVPKGKKNPLKIQQNPGTFLSYFLRPLWVPCCYSSWSNPS